MVKRHGSASRKAKQLQKGEVIGFRTDYAIFGKHRKP